MNQVVAHKLAETLSTIEASEAFIAAIPWPTTKVLLLIYGVSKEIEWRVGEGKKQKKKKQGDHVS